MAYTVAQAFDSTAASPRPSDIPGSMLGAMVGSSPAMQRLFSQMRHTARYLRVATIEGEAGSGKLVAARTLHELGYDPQVPFVSCPAVQFFQQNSGLTLIPRRAGTPAFVEFPAVKKSSGGMLVLTRIHELSSAQQGLLLELLRWMDHRPGSHMLESIPRQIICLSSQPKRQLGSTSGMRSELASRLTAIRFILPPLRERREDIAMLAEIFARQSSDAYNQPIRKLAPESLGLLLQHPWPGNVRELENTVRAAALKGEGPWIRPVDLPPFVLSAADTAALPSPSADEDPNLDRAILRHIQRVLARVEGNKLRAAKMLGISRSTLYRLLDSANAN